MKSLLLGMVAAGLLTGGVSLAQTNPGAGSNSTVPTTTRPGTAQPPPAYVGSTGNRAGDAAAASGNNNQAVVTTAANAPSPAKGANSFTMGEAKSRIEKDGFSNVSGLAKDDNGVWRGTAQKGGGNAPVWLDYKGNVGAGN